jgi:hypothetical protein
MNFLAVFLKFDRKSKGMPKNIAMEKVSIHTLNWVLLWKTISQSAKIIWEPLAHNQVVLIVRSCFCV